MLPFTASDAETNLAASGLLLIRLASPGGGCLHVVPSVPVTNASPSLPCLADAEPGIFNSERRCEHRLAHVNTATTAEAAHGLPVPYHAVAKGTATAYTRSLPESAPAGERQHSGSRDYPLAMQLPVHHKKHPCCLNLKQYRTDTISQRKATRDRETRIGS
eukprot:GHVU01226611.1.p1 GENE.GHVU01226611.1~~GHVU01226611.1.p1  ORF type:complete len:161 (-),score=9.95 GHVU01226611.1:275-757(-)